MIHTVKGFSVINEAEVDVFLEFSCFFRNPTDVSNLISGSCAFSEYSLYFWNFSVHVLLKPSLNSFEHYLACIHLWLSAVVWTLFAIAIGIGMKTDLFPFCGHCCIFQICCHTECSTLTVSFFRIWNSSTGIPSTPVALFIVMLPKAHLTSHSRLTSTFWL